MKKLFIILLNVFIGINFLFADDYTGLCGENLYWQYNPQDSVLEIKGYGKMERYNDYSDVPWHWYLRDVRIIKLPEGLTSISAHAFEYGYCVREVSIPFSVESIGERAFAYCSDLFTLTIPEHVKYIGKEAFMQIPNIYYYGDAYGSPWAASCVNGYLYDNIIYRNSSKQSMVKCSKLYTGKLVIPYETQKIEEGAFSGCGSITEIVVPATVFNIHEEAFFGCTSLVRIEVDDRNPNYSSVDGVMFNKDQTVIKLYPANKVGATYNIPNSVEIIGQLAFNSSNNLQSITVPGNVRFIHKESFAHCKSLKHVTVESGVLAIRDAAFFYCTTLESIDLPESLCEIGESAFLNCRNLAKINIPSKIKIIKEYTFDRCEKLQSIYTGDHVEKIEKSAFSGCSGLEEIRTSDYLTVIEDRSFHWCDNIKTIYLGSGIRKIGAYAFDGQIYSCTIYCRAYEPPYADETAFEFFKGWTTVFVPQSSVSEYKYTSPWSNFEIKARY